MKALVRNELRELRAPVLAVLACAFLLGVIDLACNWSGERFVGLSLVYCLAASVLASFFGGANAVARETTAEKAFLGGWPISRRDIWLAKLGANFGAVLVACVLSYVICGGLLALRGYHFGATYLRITGLPVSDLVVFCLTLFAFGFSASWLATTTLGATGVAAGMLAAPTVVWTLLLLGGVADRWGPFLGFDYDALDLRQQAVFDVLPFLLLSAAVLVAGGKSWRRYPILDMRKRTRLTYRWFGALSILCIAAGIVTIMALMPRPVAAPAHRVKLAANGRRLLLLSGPESGKAAAGYDSLWALNATGGRPDLAARGPISRIDVSPDGRHVLFAWGSSSATRSDPLWIADLEARHLWRTPSTYWPDDEQLPMHWSPSGRSLLLWVPEGLMVITGQTATVTPIEEERGPIIGWRADEGAVYSAQSPRPGVFGPRGLPREPSQRPVWCIDLRTGARTVVAHVSADLNLKSVSLDGRWIIGTRETQVWMKSPWAQTGDDLFPVTKPDLQLVDTANGTAHPFPGLSPCKVPFSPDGRYLWCLYEPPQSFSNAAIEIRVLDLRTLRLTHTIPAQLVVVRSPSGLRVVSVRWSVPPEVQAFAAGRGVVLLTDAGTPSMPGGVVRPRHWIADADGGNFRLAPAFEGECLGLGADGELVVWRKPAQFVRINPQTATETVIWQP